MARPKKTTTDRRDRKIIVWVSPQEQARFLVNAVRAGMTGPDYVRAIACVANDSAAARARVTVSLEGDVHRVLVAEAGRRGLTVDRLLADYAQSAGVAAPLGSGAAQFELTDSLVRIGADLQRYLAVAVATGYIPTEVEDAVQRLERIFDRLLPP